MQSRDYGTIPTLKQVRNKWKTLLNGYKSVVDNNKKSGAKRKSNQFFKDMDEILGDRPNVTPVALASSSGEAEKSIPKQNNNKSVEGGVSGNEDSELEDNEVIDHKLLRGPITCWNG